MQKTHEQLISVVIPVHNESENIAPLVAALQENLKKVPSITSEIIFVDDSTDDTWKHITALAHSGVRGLRMSRRFGHQPALQAGLERAKGDAIIMMDGDLQHPPELLPTLIAEWRNGYDIVQTKRVANQDAPAWKNFGSDLFYSSFSKMSEVHLESGSADFRLLSRRALSLINALPEKQKFFRGLVPWTGLPTKQIEFTAPPRQHGTSSYSLKRLIALALRGFTALTTAPLTAILYFGSFVTAVGAILMIVLLIARLTGALWANGFVILASFMLTINGAILTALGILALYMAAIYKEMLHRPDYIVQEESGF